MTENSHASAETGPAQRSIEIGVAVVMIMFAAIVIVGSVQAGIDWGSEGPKAGFFPFYVGLTILASSVINLTSMARSRESVRLFADWGQLRQVLALLIPTTVYVAAVPMIGIYLSSMLLIAVFMRWLGRYRWGIVLAIAIGIPVVTYVLFEKWFLVPLPKGPIEEFLGL